MNGPRALALIVAFSLFSVHEMDAMTHAEWRLLPILSGLDEPLARDVFVWLHIPLYIGLLWALFVASWRAIAALVFCGFGIVHGVLHFALSEHSLYTFSPPIETVTVYGTALASAAYLFLDWRARA